MKARWLVGLIVLVVGLFLIVPLFRGRGGAPTGPGALAGQPAPAYLLRDDLGRPVSLDSYRGKIVVLNLWASWCPPCRAEMPDLDRLRAHYGGRGIDVIGVNEGESPDRAAAFARSLGVHYPIWIDSDQRYGRVFTALGLPTTVVIGRDGKVVHGFDGQLTFEQMRAAVDPLVATR